MKSDKHWCRKEKRMKNGWKLDGNGNIEHAWNHDYIRMDEQGLNRIKLDGGKQWIMGWEVDRDYGWSMGEEQMTMDEYGWKLVQNGWRMDEKRLEKCVEMNNMNGWKKDRRCSKKTCSKDFGLPSTKNSTWEPNLEWHVLLTILGEIVFENQLCVSCARKPILCSVSQTCFDWQARCFVTCQLLILSSPKSKNWEFLPGTSVLQLSDTPAFSKRSFYVQVRYSIYIYNYYYYPTYLMSSQPYRFADRLEDVERGWEMLEASPFLVGYSPPQHRRHSAPVPPTSSCGAAASSHFQRRSAQRSSCARVVFMVHEDVATRKSMCL